MPVAEGTITSVNGRTGTRKSDNKSFTVFEIVLNGDDQRKYQTFNKSMAAEANSFLNQPVELTFHAEMRGSYENLYVDDVRPPTSNDFSAPPEQHQQPAPAPAPAPAPIVHTQPPAEIPITAMPNGKWTPAEIEEFRRKDAAHVSSRISKSPVEFWTNIDDLVDFFRTGAKPDRFTRFPIPEEATPQGPVEQNRYVPAGAYDEPIPNHPTDDDIPFMPTSMDSFL